METTNRGVRHAGREKALLVKTEACVYPQSRLLLALHSRHIKRVLTLPSHVWLLFHRVAWL